MFTYTIEVAYQDGRCYSADTDSHGDAESAMRALADRKDVVAYAIRAMQAGKAFMLQTFRSGKCVSAECKV